MRSRWARATTCPAGAHGVSAASSARTVSQVSPVSAGLRSSAGRSTVAVAPAATGGTASSADARVRPSSSTTATNRRCPVESVWYRLVTVRS